MAAAAKPQTVLWDHPVSSYAQKIRIALREKGVSFESKVPTDMGLADADLKSDFAKGNPRMEVPVLVEGSATIFDSTIIMEYLEDKYTDKPLMPRDPAEKARQRLIEEICDTQYEAVNWGLGELNWMGRAETTGKEGLKDAMIEKAQTQTTEIQTWLEDKLNGKEWFGFGGEKFGWADVCAAPIVNRSVSNGLPLEEGTALRAWHRRVSEVPSVKKTFEEFAKAVGGMAKAKEAFLSGQRRREYRDHRLEWMVKSGGIAIVEKGMEENNIRFSWP